MKYGSNLLRVVVRHDGCGIEPRLLAVGRDGHWGLSGMQERAERTGSRLRLWSAPMLIDVQQASIEALPGSPGEHRSSNTLRRILHGSRLAVVAYIAASIDHRAIDGSELAVVSLVSYPDFLTSILRELGVSDGAWEVTLRTSEPAS